MSKWVALAVPLGVRCLIRSEMYWKGAKYQLPEPTCMHDLVWERAQTKQGKRFIEIVAN